MFVPRLLAPAARHLFRHFDDAKALRNNPIASSFFQSSLAGYTDVSVRELDAEFIAHLHAEVRRALLDIKKKLNDRTDDPGLVRAIQIFERCVMSNEAPQFVAGHLGISKRQFARDKARALSLIARSLLARTSTLPSANACCVLTASLNACIVAAEQGHGNRALSQLYEMAEDVRDTLSRVAILANAAQIAFAYARLSTANECVDRLRSVLVSDASDTSNKQFANAVISLIVGECQYEKESSEAAIMAILRSIEELRASAIEGVPGAHLLLASALNALAEYLADRGLYVQAEEAIVECLLHLSAVPSASAAFEARALHLLALIRMAQEKRGTRLDACIQRCEALAVSNGLLNQLAGCLLNRAQLAKDDGDLAVAGQRARECLDTIGTARNNAAAAGIAVGAVNALRSSMTTSYGVADLDIALTLRDSIGMLPPASGNWSWANVLLAGIKLSQNDPEAALAYANCADAAAKTLRPPRERARTLACLAEVEAGLGNRRRARSLIAECLEVGEKYERPIWLARHYALAARLTGERRYTRLAAQAYDRTGTTFGGPL
jgi:hypothetical protein